MRLLNKLKRRPPPVPSPAPSLASYLPELTRAPRIYEELDALPMDRFIKVVTTGELKYLLIEGEADPLELGRAWSGLFLDYLDALRYTDGRHKYQLANEIAVLSSRIARFEIYIELLQIVYADELRDAVRAMGFEDLSLDPDALEDYLATLQDLKNRSKEWRLDLQLKKIELEEVMKEEKEKGAQGLDQQYFLRILDRIATHRHVAVIRASEITVAEFCAMVNELIDFNKTNKQTAF